MEGLTLRLHLKPDLRLVFKIIKKFDHLFAESKIGFFMLYL